MCPIQKGTDGSNACQSRVAAAGKLCVQYKKGQMVLMHVTILQQLQLSCVQYKKVQMV